LELTAELKTTYIETAKALKGSEGCVFMARIVKSFGYSGQSLAEKELGWCRNTIRKGKRELESGIPIADNFAAGGRKKVEEKLPHLLADISAIVDGHSQTDPTFQTTRLYTRISARAVRQALIEQKGYSDEQLPTEETIMNYICISRLQK
jgi:hypothetical protein